MDYNGVSLASCSAWEEDAVAELNSLLSAQPKLKDLKCKQDGISGDYYIVNCKGEFIFIYGNETQEISLEPRTFLVAYETNEYLMCGYAK